jgi:hypothetical protein
VLTKEETAMLVRLYDEQPLTVDKLPYTQDFDALVVKFRKCFGEDHGHHTLYNTLIRLRKQKCLIKKFRKNKV